MASPSYRKVCNDRDFSDYAETIRVEFDAAKLPYDDLLDSFFNAHDATARGKSRQYAAVVFAHDAAQRAADAVDLAAIRRDDGDVEPPHVAGLEDVADDASDQLRLVGVALAAPRVAHLEIEIAASAVDKAERQPGAPREARRGWARRGRVVGASDERVVKVTRRVLEERGRHAILHIQRALLDAQLLEARHRRAAERAAQAGVG